MGRYAQQGRQEVRARTHRLYTPSANLRRSYFCAIQLVSKRLKSTTISRDVVPFGSRQLTPSVCDLNHAHCSTTIYSFINLNILGPSVRSLLPPTMSTIVIFCGGWYRRGRRLFCLFWCICYIHEAPIRSLSAYQRRLA